ncbi:hypothetical protein H310_05503 [Aphanomyces invadans]|uniref:Cyclin-like domain-containing protein n=1 Tax=Aphanomyces invadans TaxID=157072 RepID=A0A024UA31_9STRA|nr:hypothetical protein H310_05503 [Aphanomyces invadans]ETW03075.1 hypothetical protein H310_05503 [Aphanomyces invadans]|eukprot:XP_008868459.1 hypothetical protein H310_05503 [Aphanomyces invadans]
MSYLSTSTHLNNWIFTPDQLQQAARLKANKARKQWAMCAANPLLPRKPRSFACLLPSTTNATMDSTDWNDALEEIDLGTVEDPSIFLTDEEEAMVVDFYQIQVQNTCTSIFKTSDKVKAAALLLFKRFYLSNSIMEFHPKYIGATSIYVAGKVEEQYISVETLVKSYEGVIKESDVVAHEMIVLEGVRFQLIMYHPFRSLTGFIDDLRAFAKSSRGNGTDVPLATLQTLHATATGVINELLLTDSPFLYAPSIVALAALQVATADSMNINWAHYLTSCKRSQGQPMQRITQAMDEILQLRTTRDTKPAASEAQLKAAYKKLKTFFKSAKKAPDDGSKGAKDDDHAKEPKKKKHKSSDGKKAKKPKKGDA